MSLIARGLQIGLWVRLVVLILLPQWSAWLNFVLAEQQFLNLHGERGARLSRDQSVHPEVNKTRLFKFLSPFLLFAPTSYLNKLQETSVDSLVNKPSWTSIKGQLTEEWKDSALFVSFMRRAFWRVVNGSIGKATVLLNANVAFLAIQSVDEAERSNAQRASYFSVLTSMGAIILGLLLTRQHQHIFNVRIVFYKKQSSDMNSRWDSCRTAESQHWDSKR